MRYTAFAAVVIGVLAGCYAAYQYAGGGSPGEVEDPSVTSLVLQLAFAALLVAGGLIMWVFTRNESMVSKVGAARPARGAGVPPARKQ